MSKYEQEKRETLAAIAEELRDDAARADTEQYYTLDDAAESMREYASRLEAALKRERESVTKCNGFGNAAATYAALVKIHDLTNALDEECGVDPVEIRDIARAALSAPARNCDIHPKRDEANKMLDHLLYIQQMAANGQQMKGAKA